MEGKQVKSCDVVTIRGIIIMARINFGENCTECAVKKSVVVCRQYPFDILTAKNVLLLERTQMEL